VTLSRTKDTTCFVCGPDNPLGLQVPFEPNGEAGSSATYIARKEHGGWNGILHGGVTLSLIDEAFAWCLYFQSIPAVTARIETSFHQPIPLEPACTFEPALQVSAASSSTPEPRSG
jgi:acyl-coenzyme A thioesterase PaaI-like protein